MYKGQTLYKPKEQKQKGKLTSGFWLSIAKLLQSTS